MREAPSALAHDVLHEKLRHADPHVRKTAAQAMWRRRSPADVPALQVALLEEKDPRVVKWLAYALARIGDVASLAILNPKLAVTTDQDARDWITVSRELLLQLVNNGPELGRIRDLLLSDSIEAQREGAVLSWTVVEKPVDIHKSLVTRIDSDSAGVRRWAILSTGKSDTPPPTEPIIERLADTDYLVREWSEHVLAQLVIPGALSGLIRRLNDHHPRVREWAIKALAAYEYEGIPVVIMDLYRTEGDELCREAMVLSLRRWLHRPDVKSFLAAQFTTEESLVVGFALVELVQGSEDLRTDPDVIQSILGAYDLCKDPMLHSQMMIAVLEAYSPEELAHVRSVLGSQSALRLLNFLQAHSLDDNALVVPGYIPPYSVSSDAKASLDGYAKSYLNARLPFGDIVGFSDHHDKHTADIALVIALREEFREFFPWVSEPRIDKDLTTGATYYQFGVPLHESEDVVRCVATFIGEMGPSAAATYTERLLGRYDPSIAINIGLAAALDDDIRIGDVVVAKQVDGYIESAKAIASANGGGFKFQLGGRVFNTTSSLVQAAMHFEFENESSFESWQLTASQRRPDATLPEEVAASYSRAVPRKVPAIVEGHVASGPIVGAADEFRDWLKTRDRKYCALDMESIGFMDAAMARSNPSKTFVIRAISDLADNRKSAFDSLTQGAYRRYAMQNAISFLWTLMENRRLSPQ